MQHKIVKVNSDEITIIEVHMPNPEGGIDLGITQFYIIPSRLKGQVVFI